MKTTVIVALLTALLVGCSKEDEYTPLSGSNLNNNSNTNTNNNSSTNNNNNPPVDIYAANEALVDDKAGTYFICDAEGLGSMQKINIQKSKGTCTFAWSSGYCSDYYEENGYYVYGSYCKNKSNHPGTDLSVSVSVRGKCPECSFNDLVKCGVQSLRPSSSVLVGADVSFTLETGETYYACNAPANENYIEVLSIEPTGSTPSHYITVHFNCTLKSASGNVIRLKNAVYRSKIDSQD